MFERQTARNSATSFLYKFNKRCFGLEFMRYAGELTNNADLWRVYGSNTGDSWTQIVESKNINEPSSSRDPVLSTGNTSYTYFQVCHVLPNGDPSAMANAILLLLEDKEKADLFAARAFAKVQRLFDNKAQNRGHIDLMKKVALEDAVSDC